MITLSSIISNKFKIYQIIKEWGFDISLKNSPKILVLSDDKLDKPILAFIVKSHKKLNDNNKNFIKNEWLRREYLQDELILTFKCKVVVYIEKKIIKYQNKFLINPISLSSDNEIILDHFQHWQTFQKQSKKILEKFWYSNESIYVINQFKSQISHYYPNAI